MKELKINDLVEVFEEKCAKRSNGIVVQKVLMGKIIAINDFFGDGFLIYKIRFIYLDGDFSDHNCERKDIKSLIFSYE